MKRYGRPILDPIEGEEWRQAVGYDKYEVSNLGRIRTKSYTYMGNWNNLHTRKPKATMLWQDDRGYLYACITQDKKKRQISIHRLVAFAFVEGYRDGLEVNHKDGVKLNNASSNLEWVTQLENIRHARRIGLHRNQRRGEGVPNARLKEEQVRMILARRGESAATVGADFGVGRCAVWCIWEGRTWKHVKLAA